METQICPYNLPLKNNKEKHLFSKINIADIQFSTIVGHTNPSIKVLQRHKLMWYHAILITIRFDSFGVEPISFAFIQKSFVEFKKNSILLQIWLD